MSANVPVSLGSRIVIKPVKSRGNGLTKLHSKFTTTIFTVSSVLVAVGTFLVEKMAIDCYFGDEAKDHKEILNTYCWIHSAFILPNASIEAHPNVGPYESGEKNLTVTLKYYQWVTFMLVFQAGCFYFPWLVWRYLEKDILYNFIPSIFHLDSYKEDEKDKKKKDKKEDDKDKKPKMNETTQELQVTGLNFSFKQVFGYVDGGPIKNEEINEAIDSMIDNFTYNVSSKSKGVYSIYFYRFLACELLFLVNVILQLVLMDVFLGGAFITYGINVWGLLLKAPEEREDPINLVFPKVGKCTFRKFGHSGSVQVFDGICVLPITVVSEKLFVVLWHWLIILFILSCFMLVKQLLTVKSSKMKVKKLEKICNGKIMPDAQTVKSFAKNVPDADFFFVTQLGDNLDPYLFARFVDQTGPKLNPHND